MSIKWRMSIFVAGCRFEGEETLIKDGERNDRIRAPVLERVGRAGLGTGRYPLQPMGAGFQIFKRALAEGQQPEPPKATQPEV